MPIQTNDRTEVTGDTTIDKGNETFKREVKFIDEQSKQDETR